MDFPTYENPTAYHAQAVLDNTDLKALSVATNFTGVSTSCSVYANGGMTIGVVPGTILINSTAYNTPSGATLSIGAASVGDRRDIVYAYYASGPNATVAVAAGTPATAGWTFGTQATPPIKPTLPDNAVLLAEVYVSGTGSASPTTTITSSEIVDKRCFVTQFSNDVTATNGGTMTLKNVGTAGTYGGFGTGPSITTDAAGRVTSVQPTTLVPQASNTASGQPLYISTAVYAFTTSTYTSTSLTVTIGSTPSAGSSTTTTITYTVPSGHGLQVGQAINATGFTIAGYNGTFFVSATATTTVTVYSTNNPSSLASNSSGKIYAVVAVGQLVNITVSSPASGWTNGTYPVTAVSGNTVTVAAANTLASAPTAGNIFIPIVAAGPNVGVNGNSPVWTAAGLLYFANTSAGRNALPNSAMDFWSRGTSFTVVPGTPQWTADRFYVNCINGTNLVASQNTTSTLPPGANYALRLTPTTGGASWAIQTALETVNVLPLQGQSLTLGIYYRSSAATNRFVARAYYSTVSDNMAQGTWQDLGVYSAPTPATTTFSTATAAPFVLAGIAVPSTAVGLMFQIYSAAIVSSVVVNSTNTGFTITTAAAHNLSVGDTINLNAVSLPTGFDTTWTCAAGTTGSTIVVTGAMPSGSAANLTCTLRTNPSVTMRHPASTTFDITKLHLEVGSGYQSTATRQSGVSSNALELVSTGAVADSVLVTNNAPDTAAGSGTPTWLPIGASGTVLASNGSTSVFSPLPNSAGKNYFINGALDFWQRGTSFSSGANSYTADRWDAWGGFATAGAYTVSQTTGLTLTGFQNSIRIQRTNGSVVTTAPVIGQSMETSVFLPLAGQTVTFSFWARAGANFSASGGTMNATLTTGTGTDQRIASAYTGAVTATSPNFTLTTSWQRFTATVALASSATEMALQFSYNPTGTAGINDWMEITGVQVELGSVATNFTRAGGHIADELRLCQRYAFLMPHSTTGFAVTSSLICFFCPHPFMRTAPTASFITTSVNVDNGLTNTTSSGSTMNASTAYTSAGSRLFMTGFTGLTVGGYWGLATYPAVLLTAELT